MPNKGVPQARYRTARLSNAAKVRRFSLHRADSKQMDEVGNPIFLQLPRIMEVERQTLQENGSLPGMCVCVRVFAKDERTVFCCSGLRIIADLFWWKTSCYSNAPNPVLENSWESNTWRVDSKIGRYGFQVATHVEAVLEGSRNGCGTDPCPLVPTRFVFFFFFFFFFSSSFFPPRHQFA